jgi:type I restriction enzyme S subunit
MAGDWLETTIGEHVELATGEAFQSARFGTTPYSGTLLARGDNVKEGEFEWGEKARYWPELTPDLERYLLREGDVLLGMDGSKVGKNWVRVRKKDLPCLLVQRVARLRAKPTLDQGFLRYVIGNPQFRDYVARVRTGTSIPHISGGQIKGYEILLPPLAEQKAIGAVLGALDDKIELNRRMNATLEAMARALFRSWFVDFDPVRAKLDGRPPAALDAATGALFPEHLEDSKLGHIPKGWTAGKLGDIGTNSRRGVQPNDIAPNTPYIALEHMPRRCIALGDWDDSADVASGKSAFKKGEILFGKLRPYFHKVGVAPFDGVCSTDILVLAPKSPEWFGFLLGHASSDELIQFTDLASTGTKMPRTNWSDISSFKVVPNEPKILEAFHRTCASLFEQAEANRTQSRTLATLRDTLLPKLLSGELSLAATDKESLSVQNPSKGG